MKLTIEIECHDDDEMLVHLSTIRALVKRKLIAHKDDADFYVSIEHNNCDGHYTGNLQDGNPILPLKKRVKKEPKQPSCNN